MRQGTGMLLLMGSLLAPWSAHAGEGPPLPLSPLWPLVGGVALFLYGMLKLSDAMKLLSGERMREVVGRLAGHRLLGFLFGMGMTATLLSSAATVSMLVGFVAAELLSFSQTIGVILGANLGATVAAQLMAFPLAPYAPLPLLAGLLILESGRGDNLQQVGHLLIGLGLLFLGMGMMRDALIALQQAPLLLALAQPHPLGLQVLWAALLAALLRSTAAVVGLVLVLGLAGMVGLEGSIALILGANLGAVAGPLWVARDKSREALRVAMAQLLIKGAGVAVLVGFIPTLAEMCRFLSPSVLELTGPARLAAELPRQAANAHTFFNLLLALFFLPVAGLLVRLVERLVPDTTPAQEGILVAGAYQPRYLNASLLSTPALALGMMRRETSLMCDILEQMIAEAPEAVFAGDLPKMEALRHLDDQVDEIHEAVTRYLSRMSVLKLPPHIADEVLAAMAATAEMEAVGDIIENNLAHLAQVCSRERLRLTPEVWEALKAYHVGVLQAFKSASTAFISDDRQAAEMVLGMKEEMQAMDEACRVRQLQAVQQGGQGREWAAYSLQMDVRENLKRIYYHARRVAKLVARESDPLWPSLRPLP